LVDTWITGDPEQSAFAIDFVASLLRSLEPDDPLIRCIATRLIAQIGLGPPGADTLAGADEVIVSAVAHALLGRSDGLCLALADGRALDVHRKPGAVEITWNRREDASLGRLPAQRDLGAGAGT
jgi:hypothetical protein